MSAIRSLEATYFRLPLSRPMSSAAVALTSADHVLVRLTDDDGVTGIAEAIPRPMMYGETVGTILAVYREVLAPQLIGMDMARPARFAPVLDALIANPAAKAAFELAWLDAYCTRLSTSTATFLGGYADRVRVTAILSKASPQDTVEEALAFREGYGITAFKFKIVGGGAGDLATARALREALGPDAYLYADGNRSLDTAAALRFAAQADELALAWLEEPTPAEAILDRQRLATASPIPILADDSVATAADVAAETLGGRTHGVSLKIARSGVSESNRIAGYCDVAGVPLLVGSQGDSSIGTRHALAFAASRPGTAGRPAELGYFLRLGDELVAEPLRVRDGHLDVPRQPGAGIVLDEDKVRHYQQVTGE